MVRFIAGRIAIRVPKHIDISDLESAGVLGLIDAIGKFDPSRGIKFKTYAEIRIRGAILDELRGRDWLPRSLREKSSEVEAAYARVENRVARNATDEEVANEMGVDLEEFHSMIGKISSAAIISAGSFGFDDEDRNMAFNLLADDSGDCSHLLSESEERERLAAAIDSLPERERQVISLYYFEELTLREIGEVLGVSESRVCQIHTKTICRLKGKMKN